MKDGFAIVKFGSLRGTFLSDLSAQKLTQNEVREREEREGVSNECSEGKVQRYTVQLMNGLSNYRQREITNKRICEYDVEPIMIGGKIELTNMR